MEPVNQENAGTSSRSAWKDFGYRRSIGSCWCTVARRSAWRRYPPSDNTMGGSLRCMICIGGGRSAAAWLSGIIIHAVTAVLPLRLYKLLDWGSDEQNTVTPQWKVRWIKSIKRMRWMISCCLSPHRKQFIWVWMAAFIERLWASSHSITGSLWRVWVVAGLELSAQRSVGAFLKSHRSRVLEALRAARFVFCCGS